jgi:hypothetical protein
MEVSDMLRRRRDYRVEGETAYGTFAIAAAELGPAA